MPPRTLKKKYGFVILLDALGASTYSEAKIKEFLSARHEINQIIKALTNKKTLKMLGDTGNFRSPNIFTFGDTVIITIELASKKYVREHIWIASALMQRYLYHAMQKGILFRGSYSIGNYISDSASNTVMGEAVTDAASWYEKSEWAGLSSTPGTNTVLEYCCAHSEKSEEVKQFQKEKFTYFVYYDVPMKTGESKELYAVNWPFAFFDETLLKAANKTNPEKYFLELLKDQFVPFGADKKYEFTKIFFYEMAKLKANKSLNSDGANNAPTG
jgi:hypothetical protein